MKKIKVSVVTILFIAIGAITFQSCQENGDLIEEEPKNNVTIIREGNKIVESKLVKKDSNSVIVEIKLTNKKSNISSPIITHRFVSYDEVDLMKDISRKEESFNGVFTIEMNGEILQESVITNGIVNETKSLLQSKINKNKTQSCEFWNDIMPCIADKVNEMNIVEYVFCLLAAPACLGQTYVSCVWEECF